MNDVAACPGTEQKPWSANLLESLHSGEEELNDGAVSFLFSDDKAFVVFCYLCTSQ